MGGLLENPGQTDGNSWTDEVDSLSPPMNRVTKKLATESTVMGQKVSLLVKMGIWGTCLSQRGVNQIFLRLSVTRFIIRKIASTF